MGLGKPGLRGAVMIKSELLKLAHANPELRAHLLPLLGHAAQGSLAKKANSNVLADLIIAIGNSFAGILDIAKVLAHNMRMVSQLGKDNAVVLTDQADKRKEAWITSTGNTLFDWLKTPDGQGVVKALHFLRDVAAAGYDLSDKTPDSPGYNVWYTLRNLYRDAERIRSTMPYALQFGKDRPTFAKFADVNPYVPRDLMSRLYAIESLLEKLIEKTKKAGANFMKLIAAVEKISTRIVDSNPSHGLGYPPVVNLLENFEAVLPGYWNEESEPLSLMLEALKSVRKDIALLKTALKV